MKRYGKARVAQMKRDQQRIIEKRAKALELRQAHEARAAELGLTLCEHFLKLDGDLNQERSAES